jgi:uncharacterized protein with NAD-binding domain and iron-sulfur cluster
VAILGAGPAGLAAAMALSDSPEYSIHVYQMGWKAGGKCATGREPGHLRALQNGSHYLFGCYENSFSLLAKAHRVLAQHPAEAGGFGSFERDLVPRNLLVSKQPYTHPARGEAEEDWFRHLPQNMARPGDGTKYPTCFDYLTTALQYATALAIDFTLAAVPFASRGRHLGSRFCQWALPLCPHETGLRARLTRAALSPARALTNVSWALSSRLARECFALGSLVFPEAGARALRRGWNQRWPRAVKALRYLVDKFWELSARAPEQVSKQLQRTAILLDFVGTLVVGYWVDGLQSPGGFARIDQYDFREWLERHGARKETRECALITSWYDGIISYEGGDVEKARCSAGLTVHSLLRAVATYKGAFAYQLRAEVGDSFIAPMVRALELRGVQFHFFERVEELVVDAGRGLATAVVLGQQIADPPRGAQFIDVMDRRLGQTRRAWPSAPQCAGAAGIDPPLDSYYSSHQVSKRRLVLREAGQNLDDASDDLFDSIISALPLQVMEDVLVDSAGNALHALPGPWQECFTKLQVVESQAIRMWFNVPLRTKDARPGQRSLGWQMSPPILSGYRPPHSTWEDNSQAADIHAFPEGHEPLTIATLFGPLPTGPLNTRSRAHFEAQKLIAREAAWGFVQDHMLPLWPGLERDGAVAWEAFIDLEHRSGSARFLWQDVTANAGPNESYIACLPGTLQHRIRPHESGFENLFVAGDWTRNGFEVGTVEAAVVSGLKAAKALSGLPFTILAEFDLERGVGFK